MTPQLLCAEQKERGGGGVSKLPSHPLTDQPCDLVYKQFGTKCENVTPFY